MAQLETAVETLYIAFLGQSPTLAGLAGGIVHKDVDQDEEGNSTYAVPCVVVSAALNGDRIPGAVQEVELTIEVRANFAETTAEQLAEAVAAIDAVLAAPAVDAVDLTAFRFLRPLAGPEGGRENDGDERQFGRTLTVLATLA